MTLTRGSSGRASWSFQRGDAGNRITLGSSPSCDWQIVAGGVSQVVLFFTGGELWLGVERENRLVFLNDAAAPHGWTRVHHGDRLELGGARIGIALAPDLRTAEPLRSEPAPEKDSDPGARRRYSPEIKLVEKPSAAIVRLVRGTSERTSSWFFRASDLGASVSVGASKHCDWPLSTGGLAIRELTLLFAGGILLARREQPGNRVRLNSQPLGDDWTLVPHGGRIEIGLACLEFQLAAERPSMPSLPASMRLPRGSAPKIDPSATYQQQPPPPATRTPLPIPPPLPAKAKADPTIERANLVLRDGAAMARVTDDGGARRGPPPLLRPRRHAVEMSKQSMEAQRPPEAWVQACVAPNRKPHRARVKITGYAVFGLLLAALYAGWIVLLERL